MMFKHLFRGLALSALTVGLMTSTTSAQNGSNFKVLTNGLDVIYAGLGAGSGFGGGPGGGTGVATTTDGMGTWLDGKDMKGVALLNNGTFGYRSIGFRSNQCVLGAPLPAGLRIDFPLVALFEYDGRNANTPDVFLLPGCVSAGINLPSVIPYGMPAGASESFLVSNIGSVAPAWASSLEYLQPNNGFTGTSPTGTETLLALGWGSLAIASTGFCWSVQFNWVPSAVGALDGNEGWWYWWRNSRDNNQYWAMSNDELNIVQSQSVATQDGLTTVNAFFASTDLGYMDISIDPSTNDALAPVGFQAAGTYYATSTDGSGGAILNGGFDLGRHVGASLSSTYGATNPNNFNLGAQDPGTTGFTPALGFVTWNNRAVVSGLGGFRLTWIQFDWDLTTSTDPSLATSATVLLGTVRVPVCIPASIPTPWPQPITNAFFPFYLHNTSDQLTSSLWPDPDGFPGGTFGIPNVVGASLMIPNGSVVFGICVGAPLAYDYGTSGLLGPAGPLTWDPNKNPTGFGRQLLLLP